MLNIIKNIPNETEKERDERYREYTIRLVRVLAALMLIGGLAATGNLDAVVAYKSFTETL